MTRPMIRIHDLATDEVIDREMTVAELKAHEANQATHAAIKAAEKAEAQAKATAKAAILDRIGLTADELKTILG